MTELIRKKLSDSAGARWTALFIVLSCVSENYTGDWYEKPCGF